jgi:hypothetical protein
MLLTGTMTNSFRIFVAVPTRRMADVHMHFISCETKLLQSSRFTGHFLQFSVEPEGPRRILNANIPKIFVAGQPQCLGGTWLEDC